MKITVGQIVGTILALAVLGAGWYFLAPPQLGGSTSYVEVYGTSMQPRFHAGDLAVIRGGGGYKVGEIVAYRNQQLGGHVVLHRIVRIAGGHYFFKGDNNSFVDSYHPTGSELVGRLALHVPAVGRLLVWLHGPRLILAGGIGLILVLLLSLELGGGGAKLRRRGTGAFGALPLAAAAMLLVAGGLAALAFTRPPTTHATQQGVYTQTGRFDYEATAPGGAGVYGSTTVTTGEPLFLQLVQSASFRFTYAFASTAAHRVSGTAALDARVTAANGWSRTLHLVAPQPFSGDRVTVAGNLGFASLTRLLQQVDTLTNVTSGAYTLTLLPRVKVHGLVAGDALSDSFAPKLPFQLDQNQLQLQPGSATGAGAASQLTQTTSGSAAVVTPSRISLLAVKLPVRLARDLSLGGFALALLLLLAAALLARGSRPADEHETIERLYGDLIVPVAELRADPELREVRTTSIEGLVRIAEQAERMVLHLEQAGRHLYVVEDADVRYLYGDTEPGEPLPAAAQTLRVAGGS